MLDPLHPYGNPLPAMMGLLHLAQQSKKRFNSLPQEEQDRITAEREAIKEQKRVSACISQGKCPECLGKLIRGKKDKNNGYKRTWKCVNCDKDIIN
jgi:carboxypeptidase C (cathepsin A)